MADIPWGEVLRTLSAIAVVGGGTGFGVTQFQSGRMEETSQSCANLVVEQNKACHAMMFQCYKEMHDGPGNSRDDRDGVGGDPHVGTTDLEIHEDAEGRRLLQSEPAGSPWFLHPELMSRD